MVKQKSVTIREFELIQSHILSFHPGSLAWGRVHGIWRAFLFRNIIVPQVANDNNHQCTFFAQSG
jgi:hypothetical protein